MTEEFILMLIGELGALIVSFVLIKSVILSKQIKTLKDESQQLKAKMNYYKSHVTVSSDDVQSSIGALGVDGLLDGLGLPGILKPFVKGFINSILKDPEKLKSIAQCIGVKFDNSQTKDFALL